MYSIQARETEKLLERNYIMKQKETIIKRDETLNFNYKPCEKDIFNKAIEVLRENFIATFIKENDVSLLMRCVGGTQFRFTIEKVFVE